MNNLKDKVVYITGASKGIGFGIAKKLIDNDFRVAISSRELSHSKEAALKLSEDSSRLLALESNVASMDSIFAKYFSAPRQTWRPHQV